METLSIVRVWFVFFILALFGVGGVAQAASLLTLKPRYGATAISAADSANTVLIVLSSSLDIGGSINFEYFATGRTGLFLNLDVTRRSFSQPTNIRYFVSQVDQTQLSVKGGVNWFLSKRWSLGVELNYGDYLYISPITVTTALLSSAAWPGAGLHAGYNFIKAKFFLSRLVGNARAALSSVGPVFDFEGKLILGLQIYRFGFEAYGSYGYAMYQQARLNQTFINAAVGLSMTISLGRITDTDYHASSFPKYIRNSHTIGKAR